MTKLALVFAASTALVGCTTHIDEYTTSSPKFDIKEYFSGQLVGWGIVHKFNNQVTRRFCVEIVGTWQGSQGVLDETFYFADGEISKRIWQLDYLGNGQYQGSAVDVVGLATGKQSGMAFHWQYQLDVDIEGDTVRFTMDDWMYQLDQHRVVNKTKMNKFGITAADITLFFDNTMKKCPNSTSA